MNERALLRRTVTGQLGLSILVLPALTFADPPPPPLPVFFDPYDLPDAPRPPTLPELTHRDLELTGESTIGALRSNGTAPHTEGAYVQRFSVEWPVALRRFFVGATYELAAAAPPNGGAFRPISGNLDLNARTVWATSTGLAFGGGLGATLPLSFFEQGSNAAGIAAAAATIRPWDEAFFQPNYLTLHPFFDVRDVDGPLVVQFREGLEFEFDTQSWSGFRTAAIAAAYVGYRALRWLGVGVEAFEVYFLSASQLQDDKRASFAVSPNVRLMTPYVQPALSFVTNVGTTLFGSVDTWWAIRLAATVIWDPTKLELAPGQAPTPTLTAAPAPTPGLTEAPTP
jgi:hypothetical protein